MVRGRMLASMCPHCTTHHEVETWTLVDVRRQPHVRDLILSGRIHMFDCTVCAVRVRVELPILYVDSANAFSAFYLPAEALSDRTALLTFDTRGRLAEPVKIRTSKMGGMIVADPHVVFSIAELVRYLEFREALARQRAKDRGVDQAVQ